MAPLGIVQSTPNNPPDPVSSATSQPSVAPRIAREKPSWITPSLVARHAYQIWERHGRPEAPLDRFWSQAETELRHS